MHTYEALADACHRQRVEVAFGLVGDGNVKFVHHLTAACGVPYVATRHESAAIAMAAGYARATGKTGFATVTQGPGLTNALTALTAAARARLPMVLFTGLPPTALPGHPQTIDQQTLLAVAGAGHQPVAPESVAEDVAEAFRRAITEHLPIAVCVPTDVQDAELPTSPPTTTRGTGDLTDVMALTPVAADAVSMAIDRLGAAERPMVVAGRGCLASPGATEALVRLADRLGAVLATTLPVRGLFADHPFYVGVVGGYTNDLAVEQAERADLVLAVGTSLNYRATRSGALFHDDVVLIQVDEDPSPAGASVTVDLAITGDAALVADALCAALDARDAPCVVRSEELGRRLRDGDVHAPFEDRSPTGQVHPRALMAELDRRLPAQRSVTVDGGHSSGFPSIHLSVPDQQGYLFALEFAAIGLGLGTAMGAAVGRPDRLSILVIGDGSMMMSLPDLETAVRHRIPLLVVVMNDHAYGSELVILENSGLPPDLGLFGNPSFEAMAVAMGAKGHTVHSISDLESLDVLLGELDGPLVVDAMIDPAVRGGWLKGAFSRSLVAR